MFSYVFSRILQEGCLKMLSSSANHILFFANYAKVGVSPRRFAKFAFARFFAILCLGQCAKSTFFLPRSIKMYVFIVLLDVVLAQPMVSWTSENETPLYHNASFGLIFRCGSRSANDCRECQKIGHLSIKITFCWIMLSRVLAQHMVPENRTSLLPSILFWHWQSSVEVRVWSDMAWGK